MVMQFISASQFKARCLALLDDVAITGEEIVVTKRGRPVARLVAIDEPRPARGLRDLPRLGRRADRAARRRVGRDVMIVLDTHAWLWWVAEPARLSRPARRAIDEAEAIVVSAVSAWELAMLVGRRRISLDRDISAWVRQALGSARVERASAHRQRRRRGCAARRPRLPRRPRRPLHLRDRAGGARTARHPRRGDPRLRRPHDRLVSCPARRRAAPAIRRSGRAGSRPRTAACRACRSGARRRC